MINKQNYEEYDVPVLYKVMTIKQPTNDISLEFWENIVELYETQQNDQSINPLPKQKNQQKHNKTIQLLFAKGKQGMIVIWKFQNNCLIFQKSIKIPYGAMKQITTLKAFTIEQSNIPKSGKQAQISLLLIGYYDGITQIFQIKIEENTISVSKYLTISNTTSQAVTNVAIHDNANLYVCRCHHVYLYPNLISDLYKKINKKSKQQLNCTETLLKMKQLNNSTKISIHLSQNNLHIYNQIEGLFSFSLSEMQSSGSVIDSFKVLIETSEGDLVFGASDDSVKIIYAESNEIERIVGLKSFVSTIVMNEMLDEKIIELWMADMYGEIHYMIKAKKSIVSKTTAQLLKQYESSKQNEMVIYEEEFSRSVKITQNGIKKILLTSNLLVIVDTQMNILIYDVVRNFNTLTGRSAT